MPIDLSGYNAYWTFSPQSGITNESGPWNAVNPLPSPHNCAFLQNLGTMEQAFTVPSDDTYTISYYAQRRPWRLDATQTIKIKIDGVVASSPPAVSPYSWTAQSFTRSLAAGTHVIRFEGQVASGDETYLIDSVRIADHLGVAVDLPNGNFDSYLLAAGAYVVNPPAVATASYRLAAGLAGVTGSAQASTCGRLLHCRLVRISDGATVSPGTVNQAPTVSVNGTPVGQLMMDEKTSGSAWTTWLVPLPGRMAVGRGDVVTLDADEGWLTGPAGYAESLVAAPVSANSAGRTFVRRADVARTMALGVSYAHHVTAEWHNGLLPQNQRYRCAFFNPPAAQSDAGGKPLRLSGASTSGPIINVTESNGIDATGYPTPAGTWLAVWTDRNGRTSAGLSNGGDARGSVTPAGSADLAVSGGTRRLRAFNCQPVGSAVNFPLFLQVSVSGSAPYLVDFEDLAVLAPADHSWTPGQSTIPDAPAWSDVSAYVDAQFPTDLAFGPHRLPTAGIRLGESSACRRGDVVEPADFHWAQDVKRSISIGYAQARPWTVAGSPYIYDPKQGTDYPATLTTPILTAPAPGTVETIGVAQVGDGLILSDLVLTIDSEKLLVMATPTTTAVRVMRGYASTTPATHAAGTISASGRRPVASLAAFGPSNMQVTELVTQAAHGLMTGQIVQFDGAGWPAFTYSDGRGFYGTWFNPYNMPVFVTGPNTFIVIQPGNLPPSNPSNTTLSTTYTLNPANCYTTLYLPEYGGVPYELAASLAARHPGAPARVTFPMVANPDMIDSIARDRLLPYLPADRVLWIEVGDEEWNGRGVPYGYWSAMSFMLYGDNSPYYWYGVYVASVRDRIRAIWSAAGRDPSLVKSTFNLQCAGGTSGLIAPVLNFLATKNAVPDMVEVAPYIAIYQDAATWKACAAWSTDMIVDLWIWDCYYNTATANGASWAGSQSHRIGDYKVAIDAWNAAHGGNVALGVYEYGVDNPFPVFSDTLGASMDASTTTLTLATGVASNPRDNLSTDALKVQPGTWLRCGSEWMTVVSRSGKVCTVNRGQDGTTVASHNAGATVRNDWIEATADVMAHPNYRIAHYDAIAFAQALGVSVFIPSSQSQGRQGNGWADYNAFAQAPGMGDGSDGKSDNRLTQARPGPGQKPSTKNYDANIVSVRGQGMIDFMRGSSTGGGDGGGGDGGGTGGRTARFVARRPATQ